MITFDDFKANTKEWLIGKLADMSLKEASQTISDLYDELHKPKYPKTYKECCEILGVSPYYNLRYHTYEKGFDCFISKDDKRYPLEDKLNVLGKLLICRDAYWKIAGEEMELGKPWEPDWSNNNETKFCIYTTQNIIDLDLFGVDNRILAFPTEAMRDAFYENFKDLIENCKELL